MRLCSIVMLLDISMMLMYDSEFLTCDVTPLTDWLVTAQQYIWSPLKLLWAFIKPLYDFLTNLRMEIRRHFSVINWATATSLN